MSNPLRRFCNNPQAKGIFKHPMALFAVIIAIVVAMTSGHARAETTVPPAFAARFSVTVTGNGPDVILVPGLGCSKAVWDQTVARLKGAYRLHVLQVAGFAGEPARANAEGEMLKPAVAALHDYIADNHLKPVYVGHSLGGLMGLMLASSHPEDLKSLVIVDALPFYATIFSPAATVDMIAPRAAQMRDAIAQAPDDAFAAQQKQGLAYLVSKPADQALVLGWTQASDRKVFAKAMYEDLTTDMRPVLKTLTVPTTILYPHSPATGRTPEATDSFYTAAYADLKGARLQRIDNSLHFIMLDQPEAFLAALTQALPVR